MADDRATIRLSPVGHEILREVVAHGWYREELDAFQAAVAIGIARELEIDPAELRGSTTVFNVGSLDPMLRDIVLQLAPADRARKPYEAATLYAEAGLRELKRALDGTISLSEALGIAPPAAEVTGEETAPERAEGPARPRARSARPASAEG